MAMVAASQRLNAIGLDDSDIEDDDDDDDMDHDENHPHHHATEDQMEDLKGEDPHDLGYGDPDDENDTSMHFGGLPMYAYAPDPDQDSGTLSHEGSEGLDVFEHLDNPMHVEYQWNAQSSGVMNDSAISEFQMSSASGSDASIDSHSQSHSQSQSQSQSQSTMEPTTPAQDSMVMRLGDPFVPVRRTERTESLRSETSFHSAPARAGEDPSASPSNAEGRKQQQQRPLSIAVPNAEGAAHSRRTSGLLNSFIGKRMSTRRQNLSLQQSRSNASTSSKTMGSLDNAIASLRNQDSNSEWENVAAAAAVVAASTQGGNSKTRHIQFAVDDTVLVFLTLLNVTNMEDPKDTFTVAPVNTHGYPSGEGTTELEKNGPYSFVLARVKHVHFDEDDRYYTIVRSDTGTEQRADSGKLVLC
jgi:hypothetical protein